MTKLILQQHRINPAQRVENKRGKVYAVLVHNISATEDISAAIWTCMGYTVLLCFCLFKTSSLAKGIFNAH